MKIIGVITEYNPFHNGHLYHIEKAKELSQADAVVVVMSGNFVQRGNPAVMPKHLRAEMALKAGASVIFELPVCYATGSAEFFAEGAVSLFHKLGCIDAICFGSECGDISALKRIADILIKEPQEYKEFLQSELKSGLSFPKARQNALGSYLKDESLKTVLEHPNNILGIEYIKALSKHNSEMKAFTIQRTTANYHSETLDAQYSSASAIRNLIKNTEFSQSINILNTQIPTVSLDVLKNNYNTRYPVYADDFSLLLKYKLLSENKSSLTKYMDVSEELANRIINRRNEFLTFEQFCDLLKSKELTYSRISRALIHILLNIKQSDLNNYAQNNHCEYGHILGFRKDSTQVLKEFKNHSSVPILTKLTQTDELSESAKQMLDQDIFASDLYESVITDKFKSTFINEYSQSLKMI